MCKTILHADMDAFFAAVEQRDHPEWRDKPVVVGAPPDQRGVVSAASYEARAFGIHSAMPSSEAGRRCPHAIFAPVRFARYREVSRQVFHIFERFTPWIEPLSIDEAFLDVTGSRRLYGEGREIAEAIRQSVLEETGLTISVGIAPNKFLAKLASDLNKPDGFTIVPRKRTDIIEFLAPLPISRLWGVGKVTQRALERVGLHTIGDLQRASRDVLTTRVGRHGAEHLWRLSMGEDERAVGDAAPAKSISREHTFNRDCRQPRTLEQTLLSLVEDVAHRLRTSGQYAGQIHLKIRWAGFQTITRQRRLDRPLCDNYELRDAAFQLFRAQPMERPVRLLGFGVSRFTEGPAHQLNLFEDRRQHLKNETLSHTIDRIRDEYGADSIRRASHTRPT